jgi:hypothetical protein
VFTGRKERNSKYCYVYNTILRIGLTVLNDVASLCCLFRSRKFETIYIPGLRTRVGACARVRALVCVYVCVRVCVCVCVRARARVCVCVCV